MTRRPAMITGGVVTKWEGVLLLEVQLNFSQRVKLAPVTARSSERAEATKNPAQHRPKGHVFLPANARHVGAARDRGRTCNAGTPLVLTPR